ncbi:Hypothetical predicted protein [Octopus vulgaris]|uniref:Uncharacterized protein n=1 Tax=Octopus vulgaris TaxID=6645 RepID=A0AA36AEU2_OCTVU|nr:Hypothetical predicted protein [Octopus vulgaris]
MCNTNEHQRDRKRKLRDTANKRIAASLGATFRQMNIDQRKCEPRTVSEINTHTGKQKLNSHSTPVFDMVSHGGDCSVSVHSNIV